MMNFKTLILLMISFAYQSFIFAASQFENIAPVLFKEQTDAVWATKQANLLAIKDKLIFKEEALQQGAQRVDFNQSFTYPTTLAMSVLESKLCDVKTAITTEEPNPYRLDFQASPELKALGQEISQHENFKEALGLKEEIIRLARELNTILSELSLEEPSVEQREKFQALIKHILAFKALEHELQEVISRFNASYSTSQTAYDTFDPKAHVYRSLGRSLGAGVHVASIGQAQHTVEELGNFKLNEFYEGLKASSSEAKKGYLAVHQKVLETILKNLKGSSYTWYTLNTKLYVEEHFTKDFIEQSIWLPFSKLSHKLASFKLSLKKVLWEDTSVSQGGIFGKRSTDLSTDLFTPQGKCSLAQITRGSVFDRLAGKSDFIRLAEIQVDKETKVSLVDFLTIPELINQRLEKSLKEKSYRVASSLIKDRSDLCVETQIKMMLLPQNQAVYNPKRYMYRGSSFRAQTEALLEITLSPDGRSHIFLHQGGATKPIGVLDDDLALHPFEVKVKEEDTHAVLSLQEKALQTIIDRCEPQSALEALEAQGLNHLIPQLIKKTCASFSLVSENGFSKDSDMLTSLLIPVFLEGGNIIRDHSDGITLSLAPHAIVCPDYARLRRLEKAGQIDQRLRQEKISLKEECQGLLNPQDMMELAGAGAEEEATALDASQAQAGSKEASLFKKLLRHQRSCTQFDEDSRSTKESFEKLLDEVAGTVDSSFTGVEEKCISPQRSLASSNSAQILSYHIKDFRVSMNKAQKLVLFKALLNFAADCYSHPLTTYMNSVDSEVNLVEACEESIQAIEKEYKDHSKINKFLVSDALHALRALREGRDSFIARFKKEEAAAKD